MAVRITYVGLVRVLGWLALLARGDAVSAYDLMCRSGFELTCRSVFGESSLFSS